MPSFFLKSSLGGISDYEDKGIAGSFKFGQALDIRKQRDTLSCQQALTEEPSVGTFTALPNFHISSSDNNSYFLCRDGKIIRRNSSGAYSVVYTDTNGAIIGAAEWYDKYGNTYLYWATATQLNRKRLLGPSYTPAEPWTDVNASLVTGNAGTSGDPWPKTNLTSAPWHSMTMTVGALSFCNSQYMGLVGYDNSYTNESLDLLPSSQATCVIERNQYAIIGSNNKTQAEQSGVFMWNTTALNWLDKDMIPVKGINAMIDTDIPLMQVGSNGLVYFSDLKTLLPAFSFPGGGQVNPGGVTTDLGVALFGVFGNGTGNTGVYSYGHKRKNAPPVLNFDYPLACTEIGTVTKVGTTILISYNNGGVYGVKKVNSTLKAQGIYQSLDLDILKDPYQQKLPQWQHVEITTPALVTGTSVECWYRLEKATTGGANNDGWIQANQVDGTVQFNTVGGVQGVFFIGEKARIFELMLKLNPSGNVSPEVVMSELFFVI